MSKFNFYLLCAFLSAFIISNDAFGQPVIARNKIYGSQQIFAASDIENALYADRTRRIRLSSSPKGSGEKIEVASSKADDLNYFEKEHNIVWIKFKAIQTSGLAFTIIPDSEDDDYDFLLFKSEGRKTLTQIQNKEVLPVRSNISRTKNINQGLTGLRLNEKNTHNKSGVNAGFSQTIDVVDGEVYFLAIDNVYENGEGATIEFMYFEEQVIEGTVIDSEKQPVEAEIVWENSKTSTELSVTHSNPEDGSFRIIVPYEKKVTNEYTLSIFSDDCLFEEITYTPVKIETTSSEKLNVILPKLKKGLKAPLNNINFVGGKSILLKTAYPSLRRLLKLMKKNKDLKIHIVGHTNGCQGGINPSQELSESRAEVTQEHLINKGIKGDRITTEGRNCEEMLHPITSSEKLQSLNRRIEVNVTSY